MNSRRRPAANSWLSGKSSCPNFCSFPSCHLEQEHSHFEDFFIVLEEIAHGSFSGLTVIPPASTGSRARNSGVRGPPPLRSRQSLLGIQGVPSKLLD